MDISLYFWLGLYGISQGGALVGFEQLHGENCSE